MSSRLRVDWTKCDGHGLCAELLPEQISLDDWGFPVLRDRGALPEGSEGQAARAVRACPVLALVLTAGRS